VLDADEINWFHSIDLGNGLVTEGHKSLEMLDAEFGRLGLTEENLAGKRVLDIGCNDGYMALRCEQLGADVTAVDGVYQEGLKYVRRHLQPRFRFYAIDLMSSSFRELGRFDVILYLGGDKQRGRITLRAPGAEVSRPRPCSPASSCREPVPATPTDSQSRWPSSDRTGRLPPQ